MNSELFFAVCQHSIFASNGLILNNIQIELLDGKKLFPEGSIYLSPSLKNDNNQTKWLDYALIKIQKNKNLTLRATHKISELFKILMMKNK